jgi:uroporphyrinogen-III synthase
MEYVIVPLASRDTALELKKRVKERNMVTLSVLGHKADRRVIERAIGQVKGGGVFNSIFTSKTAVKTLWRYVRKEPELAKKIFKDSIAIGPSTARAIAELYGKLGISAHVRVSDKHSSEGIVELLERDKKYLLWCSKSVNKVLADTLLERGDVVAPIYRIKINERVFGRLHSILTKYRIKYLIFTSVSSGEAWDRFMNSFSIENKEMYAIAISRRVAERLKERHFKHIYVYESSDLTLFPEFIKEVVLG